MQNILEMSEPRPKQKKQKRRPQPRKHTTGPPYYLGVHDNLQQNGFKKSKESPFLHFSVTLFINLIFKRRFS